MANLIILETYIYSLCEENDITEAEELAEFAENVIEAVNEGILDFADDNDIDYQCVPLF